MPDLLLHFLSRLCGGEDLFGSDFEQFTFLSRLCGGEAIKIAQSAVLAAF